MIIRRCVLEVGEINSILANNIFATPVFMNSCAGVEGRVRKDILHVPISSPAVSRLSHDCPMREALSTRQAINLKWVENADSRTYLRTNT